MKDDFSRREEIAWMRGYRITRDGQVISPKSGKPLKPYVAKRDGYLAFTLDHTYKVMIARFQGYAKFGDRIYQPGMQVRHLNGERTDNSFDNIAIGTQSENMMDRRPEDRLAHAKHAASHIRKLSAEDVIAMREARAAGAKLSELCRRYGMSKGGISDIVTGKQRVDVGGPITPKGSKRNIKGHFVAPLSYFRQATAPEIDAHERAVGPIAQPIRKHTIDFLRQNCSEFESDSEVYVLDAADEGTSPIRYVRKGI